MADPLISESSPLSAVHISPYIVFRHLSTEEKNEDPSLPCNLIP